MKGAPKPPKVETEPFSTPVVKRKIREILDNGTVTFAKNPRRKRGRSHAEEEMWADDLDMADALNVLRGGVPQPGELRDGTWRYQIQTSRMCFVVSFGSDTELLIVTAWRYKN